MIDRNEKFGGGAQDVVVKDVEVILGELDSFGAQLADKPMLMVASKIDAANKDRLSKLKQYCKKKKLELFPISAVTGKGIEELKYEMARRVEKIREEGLQSSEVSQSSGRPVNT